MNYIDPTGHWIGKDRDPAGAETAEELADFWGIDISGIRDILPAWIPTRDYILFSAYLKLFEEIDIIPYGPEGIYSTSGLALGMYIAKNKVEIVWDSDVKNKDGNTIELTGNAAVFRRTSDPNLMNRIFINDTINPSLNFIAGSIAHEAFHLTLPFDTTQDSQIEEMSAITIGYRIRGYSNAEKRVFGSTTNLITHYTETDLADYVNGFCSSGCSYSLLSAYPNNWQNILTVVLSSIIDNP